MRGLHYKFVAAATLAASSLAVSQPASAAGVSIRTLAAQEARLATMAYRIATANAHLCTRTDMLTGMILHDLTQYEPGRRAEVSRAFSLQSGFGVLQLVPDSAGARAGLRMDDEITAVGSTSVEDHVAVRASAKSVRRMEGLARHLQQQLNRGSTQIVIRRAGQLLTLELRAERGCSGQLSLAASAGMNAWADGRHIILTTGMDRFARSDDEIAFVIAHEMAHNILGHLSHTGANGIFGSLRGRSYERDADAFAVRLMQGAGYRPAAAISFLERSRRRLWWAFSLDHPGFGSRIKTVSAEIARWGNSGVHYRAAARTSARIADVAIVGNPAIVSDAREPAHAQAAPDWQQAMSWNAKGTVSRP